MKSIKFFSLVAFGWSAGLSLVLAFIQAFLFSVSFSLSFFWLTFSILFVTLIVVFFVHIVTPLQSIAPAINRLLFYPRKKIFGQAFENPLHHVEDNIHQCMEQKEQEQAQLTDKTPDVFRREFLADISHELKTPLFAAQGYVQTLLHEDVKKSIAKKFLKKTERNLERLNGLVKDLLELSELESPQYQVKSETIVVAELVDEVISWSDEKIEKKKIVIFKKCSPDTLALGNRKLIGTALHNLIANAIQYSPDKSTVTLRAYTRANHVVLSVIDNGEGIPSDEIPRLFERFYRVDKSRSRKYGGNGLGLAIVRRILELHRTTIDVKSEMGRGSVFSFSLPKATQA